MGLARQNFIATTALDGSRAASWKPRVRTACRQPRHNCKPFRWRCARPHLTTPIGGWVSKRHAVPGEKLQTEQPVVTVVDLSQLELAGLVGTHEVARLKPGMPAQLCSIEGSQAETVAARIGPHQPGGRGRHALNRRHRSAWPNAGELLRAGQYAVASRHPGRPRTASDPARHRVARAPPASKTVWVIDKGETQAPPGHHRPPVMPKRAGLKSWPGWTPPAQVLVARYDNLREGSKALVDAAKSDDAGKAQSGRARHRSTR